MTQLILKLKITIKKYKNELYIIILLASSC